MNIYRLIRYPLTSNIMELWVAPNNAMSVLIDLKAVEILVAYDQIQTYNFHFGIRFLW